MQVSSSSEGLRPKVSQSRTSMFSEAISKTPYVIRTFLFIYVSKFLSLFDYKSIIKPVRTSTNQYGRYFPACIFSSEKFDLRSHYLKPSMRLLLLFIPSANHASCWG
jgi:hypothetical protein